MKYIFMLLLAVLVNTALHAQIKLQTDTASKATWYCPMHPTVVSHKPGTCTQCGMKLVKKKIYTCGMHPDIITDKPGKCPKCGMGLVEKKER